MPGLRLPSLAHTGDRHEVAFAGIHGQRLFVDPVSGLVLEKTAVRTEATSSSREIKSAVL